MDTIIREVTYQIIARSKVYRAPYLAKIEQARKQRLLRGEFTLVDGLDSVSL
ncbi:MAG: hypothetical protein ACJAVV_001449 [Alphaproteobacteria bacterium]|jgi:hypothetical protein